MISNSLKFVINLLNTFYNFYTNKFWWIQLLPQQNIKNEKKGERGSWKSRNISFISSYFFSFSKKIKNTFQICFAIFGYLRHFISLRSSPFLLHVYLQRKKRGKVLKFSVWFRYKLNLSFSFSRVETSSFHFAARFSLKLREIKTGKRVKN